MKEYIVTTEGDNQLFRELIRCKDCKYYREGECWCENDNDGRKYYQSVIENPLPDDFCSYAERRDHDSD